MTWFSKVFRRKAASSAPFNLHEQDNAAWKDRARIAADMVANLPLEGHRPVKLADIGCGDCKFAAEIGARMGEVLYRGFDLLPQSPEVQRYDISTEDLPESFDIAVLLGVLEYVEDVPAALERLRRSVRHLVVSHSVKDARPDPERSMRRLKWKTLMSEEEFSTALENAGFSIADRRLTANGKTVIWACR